MARRRHRKHKRHTSMSLRGLGEEFSVKSSNFLIGVAAGVLGYMVFSQYQGGITGPGGSVNFG